MAGEGLVERLIKDEIELLAVCVDAIHYHILGRFADKQVRRHVGRAKLHAYYLLRDRWQMKKVWQRLSHVSSIAERAHQVRVFDYIHNHKNRDSWVWSFRDGIYWGDHTRE